MTRRDWAVVGGVAAILAGLFAASTILRSPCDRLKDADADQHPREVAERINMTPEELLQLCPEEWGAQVVRASQTGALTPDSSSLDVRDVTVETATPRSRSRPPSTGSTSHRTDRLLAALDLGDRNPPADVVALYTGALDAAERVCDEDRQDVGDIVVHAVGRVAEEGAGPTSNLEMLRGIASAVPPEMAPTRCATVAAMIITMMIHG